MGARMLTHSTPPRMAPLSQRTIMTKDQIKEAIRIDIEGDQYRLGEPAIIADYLDLMSTFLMTYILARKPMDRGDFNVFFDLIDTIDAIKDMGKGER